MADVAVDISSLLQTTTCTVIQTIDAAKLEALLKWLVDKCTRGAGGMSSAPGADVLGSIQEQIDNMRRENTSLKGELDGLKSQLVRCYAFATTTSPLPTAVPCILDPVVRRRAMHTSHKVNFCMVKYTADGPKPLTC